MQPNLDLLQAGLVSYMPLAINSQASKLSVAETRTLVIASRVPPQRLADRASSRVLLADALYLEQFHFFHINPKRGYAASSRHKEVLSLYKKMGCCAGKLQFHKETKRQDKNEYLAAARAVEHGAARRRPTFIVGRASRAGRRRTAATGGRPRPSRTRSRRSGTPSSRKRWPRRSSALWYWSAGTTTP